MFTDFLFPLLRSGGSNPLLAHEIPESEPLTRITEEFERLAQRLPTEAEVSMLRVLCAPRTGGQGTLDQSLAGGASARSSEAPARWVDSPLPEALAHLAVAAGSAGIRVLLVSPNKSDLNQRQLRLGKRGPLLPLRDAVRSAAGARAVAAWCTPDELSPALVSRVFGVDGPQAILVEHAHTASSSSASFRPSMQNVGLCLARLPRTALLCSAPHSRVEVRENVAQIFGRPQLSAAEALIVETALLFDSPVRLDVQVDDKADWDEVISELPRPALVLCGTVAQADEVFARLETRQVPVHRFHAGLPAGERAKQLLAFALPGRRAVMVAVSGFGPSSGFAGEHTRDLPDNFGPGYSRQDLRSIVHLCAPCSLEQYTQELAMLSAPAKSARRSSSEQDSAELDAEGATLDADALEVDADDDAIEAGDLDRRNAASAALMLFSSEHLALNFSILQRKRPAPESLIHVVETMLQLREKQPARSELWLTDAQLAGNGQSSIKDLQICMRFLVDAGVIEQRGDGAVTVTAPAAQVRIKMDALADALLQLRSGDASRLAAVEQYAQSQTCRAVTLAQLLGRDASPSSASCGRCDVCEAATAADELSSADSIDADVASIARRSTAREATKSPAQTKPILPAASTTEQGAQENSAESAPSKRRAPARRTNKSSEGAAIISLADRKRQLG